MESLHRVLGNLVFSLVPEFCEDHGNCRSPWGTGGWDVLESGGPVVYQTLDTWYPWEPLIPDVAGIIRFFVIPIWLKYD